MIAPHPQILHTTLWGICNAGQTNNPFLLFQPNKGIHKSRQPNPLHIPKQTVKGIVTVYSTPNGREVAYCLFIQSLQECRLSLSALRANKSLSTHYSFHDHRSLSLFSPLASTMIRDYFKIPSAVTSPNSSEWYALYPSFDLSITLDSSVSHNFDQLSVQAYCFSYLERHSGNRS